VNETVALAARPCHGIMLGAVRPASFAEEARNQPVGADFSKSSARQPQGVAELVRRARPDFRLASRRNPPAVARNGPGAGIER
jgi:hypothetical protein